MPRMRSCEVPQGCGEMANTLNPGDAGDGARRWVLRSCPWGLLDPGRNAELKERPEKGACSRKEKPQGNSVKGLAGAFADLSELLKKFKTTNPKAKTFHDREDRSWHMIRL